MRKFGTFLVCLDLSKKDRQVLFHTAALVTSLQPERLIFFHSLHKDADHSNERKSSEEALALLSNRIADWFEADSSLETEYFVCEGPPIDEIVDLAKQSAVDLILCGKSSKEHHRDLLPHRIARKAPCSILLLPHETHVSFDHILVAVDRSESSREALQVASRISSRQEETKMILVEAIDMPYGSQMSVGASRYVDLREQARKQLASFARESEMDDVAFEVAIASNLKASLAILEAARKRNATMIVMGSKGKGAVPAMLLGSTVENVAKGTTIPLLIVKRPKSKRDRVD